MRMGTIELESIFRKLTNYLPVDIPSFVDDSEEFGFDAFAFTHSIFASSNLYCSYLFLDADNLERKIRRTAKHYNPKFSEN